MTVYTVNGDLFDPSGWVGTPVVSDRPVDSLGHGVNCYGKMGAGIAVEFKNRYPIMHERYVIQCNQGFLLPGQVMPWHAANEVVFNIASQYRPGRDAQLDYLDAGLNYVKFYMKRHKLGHLALPRIGAGIGGLDFQDVLDSVWNAFEQEDIHVTMVSL